MSTTTGAIHLRGLNGMRAIAATVVLIYHTTLSLPSIGLASLPMPNAAAFAVTIFFSLSGFLITYLLLEEKRVSQTVSLTAFYARRILRIWPLYFLYLLLCLLWAGPDAWRNRGLLYYLIMAPNIPFIVGGTVLHADHYWSLGVEEQFYVFWPALLKHSAHVRASVLCFLALFTLAKLIVMGTHGGWSQEYGLLYITRFDCMAIGAVGAWQLYHRPASCRPLIGPLADGVAWLTVVGIALGGPVLPSFLVHQIVAGATVVLIINQVAGTRPLVRLENRALDHLGRISFGIYVYHPLVLALISVWMRHVILPSPLKYGFVYAAAVLMTIALAHLSYRYFELRFLRLKERYSTVPSQSSLHG